jgi:plasmid stabilization system protein ParE
VKRKVAWVEGARRDLDVIVAYLGDLSPKAALDALARIRQAAKSLTTMAERGRVVPELARVCVHEYRELVIAPYRLIYRVRERDVIVVALFDARRSLEDVLLERLIRSSPGSV